MNVVDVNQSFLCANNRNMKDADENMKDADENMKDADLQSMPY